MAYPAPPPDTYLRDGVWLKVGQGGSWTNQLRLPANPDQDVQYDARVTLIQTLTGAYFDDYGLGVPILSLTGNTAWLSPQGQFNGSPINGWQAAKHLYRDIIQYYFSQESGHTSPQSIEIAVFDEAGGQAWRVKPVPPNPMSLTKSRQDPMVYRYTATFAIESDLLADPASPDQKPADPVRQAVQGALSPQTGSQTATAQASATGGVSRRSPRHYTVQTGDTLWSIAQSLYGQGSLWPRIWDANKDTVANPNLIFAGQVLVIPPGPAANQSIYSVRPIAR